VNVALADLLITGLVFPASVVVLLAGLTDDAGQATVCTFQWLLAVLCSLVTVMTLTGVAAENFARLCLPPECYDRLTAAKITAIILLIWAVAITLVCVQTTLELGPDYCHRRFPGVMPYMVSVAVFLVGVPTIMTMTLYAKIMARIRDAKTKPTFKPPTAFSWDYSLMKTNMYSFLLFVVSHATKHKSATHLVSSTLGMLTCYVVEPIETSLFGTPEKPPPVLGMKVKQGKRGSCHKRQKAQAPTPQAPIRNRKT